MELDEHVDEVTARTGFAGVVRVDAPGEEPWSKAYGLADRAHGVAMTVDTRIGVASGAKGVTALAVVALVDRGVLGLATPVRELLGDDLPSIDPAITVEHLLSHRSGMGDYLDEDARDDINAYVMPVPVHQLVTAESYLPLLSGHEAKFAPGADFSYCNSGFVLLALIAERASGTPFHELVRRTVIEPAGLTRTGYLRSDELPGDAARGYLTGAGLRTNALHLPVIGGGDGGIFTTAADATALWRSLFAGRIISPDTVESMVRPRTTRPDGSGYGLGVWLPKPGFVRLSGMDAGASFCSWHAPASGLTWSVLGTTSDAAWPVVDLLNATLS